MNKKTDSKRDKWENFLVKIEDIKKAFDIEILSKESF